MITYLDPATRAVVEARGMPNTAREIFKLISIFAPMPRRVQWLEQVDAITSSPYAEAFASEAENRADRAIADAWQDVNTPRHLRRRRRAA